MTYRKTKSRSTSSKRLYHQKNDNCFFAFALSVITNVAEQGKTRTAETYTSALNSFKKFRNEKEILLSDLNAEVISEYEKYLKNKYICPNSISFYMRNLRAIYNRAVKSGLTQQQSPFKDVYTGIDKTIKRSISLKTVQKIKDLQLRPYSVIDFARDMFLFSFYTRGMSFIDIAYLQKRDLQNGYLIYYRRKTGQKLIIKWEKCMQNIVDKYYVERSPYLLPIIDPTKAIDERRQYIYCSHKINMALKTIGKILSLPQPLTMYVSRHTWASVAHNKKLPISVISEGLGHNSEKTTRIYLSSLNNIYIDKANLTILRLLK